MKQGVQKRVFVGLSGGVDSSVAALRLQKAGYEVVGVFIKVWQPDFIACNWEAERLDAMRVAAHLNIPFLTCDAEDAYKRDVADYFIEAYLSGQTPNPDVMCNQHVKFGRFLDFARDHGADFIATGHYAQKKTTKDGHELWRGNDTEKDQSYFLWTLTQEQLTMSLLPVGDSPKQVIRKEAEIAKIPVAAKKDSQGICFLGHVDIPDFLSHFTDLTAGPVLDEQGAVVGEHRGALVYTIGQRHGFTIFTKNTSSQPHYVVDRDLKANTITVAPHKKQETSLSAQHTLTATNWIPAAFENSADLTVQIRYRQQPIPVSLTTHEPNTSFQFTTTAETPAAGQSAVFYRGQQCLGGGIIA